MISEVTNEDCMLMMARYPDKHFDLAIVDPPYGIGMGCGAGETRGNGKKKKDLYIQKDWDLSTPNKQYFDELIRVSNNQLNSQEYPLVLFLLFLAQVLSFSYF